MTRPPVTTSVFIGDAHRRPRPPSNGRPDGPGSFRRPPGSEQLHEGLRPWSPLKVYGSMPFVEPTKSTRSTITLPKSTWLLRFFVFYFFVFIQVVFILVV